MSSSRRLGSDGKTYNFNIDKSRPSTETTINGESVTVYGDADSLRSVYGSVTGGNLTPSSNITVNDEDLIADLEIIVSGKPNTATVQPEGSAAAYSIGSSFVNTQEGNRLPNELENFASFNTIFTLGALSADECNDPENTYRKKGIAENVILRSGGGNAKNVNTAYEQDGSIEYFIDDVEIESLISTSGKTGAATGTAINFTVHEPYSMGLFLQTVQLAAIKAGYTNYLEAPYLLTIEFAGWDQNGNNYTAQKSKRHIPLMFINMEFNVSQGGSVYTIEAVPYNEIALSDEIQTIKTETSFTGTTVAEMLNNGVESLATIINGRLQDQKEKGEIKSNDYYIINFPKDRKTNAKAVRTQLQGILKQDRPITEIREGEGKDPDFIDEEYAQQVETTFGDGARVNSIAEALETITLSEPNEIGTSTILKDSFAQGDHPFGLARFSHQSTEAGESTNIFKRNGNEGVELNLSSTARQFKFPSGYKIQKIIEEVVLTSDYGRKISEALADENGMVNWFKIETQVFVVPDSAQTAQTGTNPKIYVYSVVPFKIAKEKIVLPTQGVAGQEQRKNVVNKVYDYIYTGNNRDIINFDIEFKTAFYSSVQADKGQLDASARADASKSAIAEDEQGLALASGDAATATAGKGEAQKTIRENITNYINSKGGAGFQEIQTGIARQYHGALVNSQADMIMSQLTIWGDPYFIPDSGMGNYNAAEGENINITEDGSVDYQRSEVDIIVNFRTPVDYRQNTPFMEFPQETIAVKAFSGLYQVITVINKFSKNQFTQELELVRRNNQELKEGLESGVFTPTQGRSPMLDSGTVPEGIRQEPVGNTERESPQLIDKSAYVKRVVADPLSVLSDAQREAYNAGNISDDIRAALAEVGGLINEATQDLETLINTNISAGLNELNTAFAQAGLGNLSGSIGDIADDITGLAENFQNIVTVADNTAELFSRDLSNALNSVDDLLPDQLNNNQGTIT